MADGLLEGKTILITGVGSGLGRELATQCVADGANVVLGARTEDQLRAVAEEVDPSGEHVAFRTTDITDEEACAAIVAEAERRFGQVDGLAQVAAFEFVFGGLHETDFDLARQAWETNVIGTLKIMRPTVDAMRRAGGGAVALIGSQSMWTTLVENMGYGASKGALVSSMYYLADELGPDHIRVNTVVPSWMWGPPVEMYVDMQSEARGVEKQQVIDEIVGNIPLGEIVPDEEVARAVTFFLSDRSRMITGQSLLVNGGELMR
jgi:NAD(P)-dependent dehydrogenase (short-subunit alcohol dehydrogenase family)